MYFYLDNLRCWCWGGVSTMSTVTTVTALFFNNLLYSKCKWLILNVFSKFLECSKSLFILPKDLKIIKIWTYFNNFNWSSWSWISSMSTMTTVTTVSAWFLYNYFDQLWLSWMTYVLIGYERFYYIFFYKINKRIRIRLIIIPPWSPPYPPPWPCWASSSTTCVIIIKSFKSF